jgi:iron complex transport system ATP-binding protein
MSAPAVMLAVEGLGVSYGDSVVLRNLDFCVRENEWWMVVGPNGSGKSTLVGAVAQGLDYTGRVAFEGTDLAGMRPRALARLIAVLTQQHEAYYSFSVDEVVRLGRYAWQSGLLGGHSATDDQMVAYALAATGMEGLRGRGIDTLSGGELQRAFLAQVLAQDARLMLLDEATNHLDLAYQRQVFDLVARWVRMPGRAVVSVVHDLTLARAYGTHALLLGADDCIAGGVLNDVFVPGNLERAFDMDVYGWLRGNLAMWD